jgi:hypothetical protein
MDMSHRTYVLISTFILLLSAACQAEIKQSLGTLEPESRVKLTASFETPTAAPASASAPTRAAAAATPTMLDLSDILLQEDFSGPDSCVERFENERARAEMLDGAFVLEVHAADELTSANCETLVAGDFSMEVDIVVQEFTPGGAYYFGLLFRVSGDERYAFVVGSEGGYCVYYAKDTLFIPLTSSTDFGGQCWTQLPQSAQEEGTQRLRVVALADRIDVYLNGELLAVVRDGQLRSGWVGFVAATAGEGDLTVAFDNLVITTAER